MLAGYRRKLAQLGDDAGEVEVGVHVSVHVGQMSEKLAGEGARVWALLCGILAGCMFVISGRGTWVGVTGYLLPSRI